MSQLMENGGATRYRTKYYHLTIWVPGEWDRLDAASLAERVEHFFECRATEEHIQFVRWQLERCPDTGRLHIQAAIQWRKPEGVRGLLTRMGVPNASFHAEPITYNWDTFANYANKERTRVGDTAYEWGILTLPTVDAEGNAVPGDRQDVKFAGEFLRRGTVGELAALRPDLVIKYHKGLETTKRYLVEGGHGRRRTAARRTFVLCGPTGTGKTSGVYDHYGEPDVFSPPISQGDTQWYDGLLGQKIVVLDEFQGKIPYDVVKRLTDPWINEMVPIKGTQGKFVPDVVFIISNKLPWQWWKWQEFGIDQLPELIRRITAWVWFGPDNEPVPDNGVGGMVIPWTRRKDWDWGVGCRPCPHVRINA